jgi:hypothetical protein
MDCLIDYIGLKNCPGATDPESGLFINDLPGMPLEAIDKITSSQHVTYFNTWNSVQLRAVKKFALMVVQAFQKRYRIKSIRKSFDLLRNVDATGPVGGTTEYVGGYLDLSQSIDGISASNLMLVSFQSLAIYVTAKTESDTAVKIVDGGSYDVLFTSVIPAQTDAGWYNIPVNKLFNAEKLEFIFQTGRFLLASLELTKELQQNFCSCTSAFNCDGIIKGIKADNNFLITDSGIDTFGMSAVFSLVCKYDKFICNNKATYATALWYLQGAEMMIERIHSPRINFWTINDKDALELLAYYQSQAEEELKTAIDGICLDTNDCCLECDQTVAYVESTM